MSLARPFALLLFSCFLALRGFWCNASIYNTNTIARISPRTIGNSNDNINRGSRLIWSRTAFAGGGFGSKTSSNKTASNKKKKKKRGGKLLSTDSILSAGPAKPTQKKQEEELQLDRFGLPIRTAENFFPPLPEDTTLIGVNTSDGGNDETNMVAAQKAMKQHIELNFNLFDKNGVEKEEFLNGGRKPWKLKLLHKSPPVFAIEDFFTPEECKEYIDLTTPQTQNNDAPLQVNSATFSPLAQSKRTSTTWYCHYSQVPTFLSKARRLLNNFPLEQMEEAQIVRYRTGEEFSWHYDEVPTAQLVNGGQRVGTLLVYLNTISKGKGGGTIFRDLKKDGDMLTMRPKMGSALLFFPASADGTPDDRTLHKGEVAIDEKMIAQMWFHERKYDPVIPEGNTKDGVLDLLDAKDTELGF